MPSDTDSLSSMKSQHVDSLVVHRSIRRNSSSFKILKRKKSQNYNSITENSESPNQKKGYASGLISGLNKEIENDQIKEISERYCQTLLTIATKNNEPIEDIINDGLILKTLKENPIIITHINFCSIREYDMFPMPGVYIAYIAETHKINRRTLVKLVDYYTKGFQKQDSIAVNIAEAISGALNTEDVAVKVITLDYSSYIGESYETDEPHISHYFKGNTSELLGPNLEPFKHF
ncbi:hypothetical protein HZS_7587 [Henneguya salminicola]|nr:hypothetical protein HZS_7587 [Henneguya salminicola]